MIVRPWGFDIDVEVDIDEGEPPTMTSPGVDPFVIILSAKVGGVEIYEMLGDAQLLRLEAAVGRACNL
jgi:hypothetical protein